MRAVDRLFFARCEFDDSWRAHAAALRASVVLAASKALTPSLVASLKMAKGFDPGIDGDAAIDDLFDELDYMRSENYAPMRKNCILGVCASFESFVKTFAAALSYDSDWRRTKGQPSCLGQDTEGDFAQRFAAADKRWKGKNRKFLEDEFAWVGKAALDRGLDVIWLRNQIAHNAGFARETRNIPLLNEAIQVGQKISLDAQRLGVCVLSLRDCVKEIAEGTPYRDAI